MKLIHLSDLHLGIRLNEYSLLEDQEYILTKILNVIDEEKPDAVVIAGDLYDRPDPPSEAVRICDEFLVSLAGRRIPTFIISGNHDSAQGLAFANRLIDASGIHFSPVYGGKIEPITLRDAYGPVNIYMLPFIKPIHARRFFREKEIKDYTDALSAAVSQMKPDPCERNVLISHQYVTGAERSDSEDNVGGLDNVDASVFDGFDYVALGHLHGPQNVGSERIRYCGTPLKYSFSEAEQKKSVTVAELGEKGSLTIRERTLVPVRELAVLRGKYAELMSKDFYEGTSLQEDYVRIILTDEDEIMDVQRKLRTVYHNLMQIDYDKRRTRHGAVNAAAEDVPTRSPAELFEAFFLAQNGYEMSEQEKEYVRGLIEDVWEGGQ